MNFNNLFSIPVAICAFQRGLSNDELNFIKNQPQQENLGNTSSKDSYILNDSTLCELKQFCHQSVNQFFKEVYQPKNAIELRITQSWCNFTQGGQYHHRHNHSNSIISGVFYVQTTNKLDKIHFFKTAYSQFNIPTDNYNMFNSSSWYFDSIQGELILFPSSLEHCVHPTNNDSTTRISISFNTFFTGHLGKKLDFTELFL